MGFQVTVLGADGNVWIERTITRFDEGAKWAEMMTRKGQGIKATMVAVDEDGIVFVDGPRVTFERAAVASVA